ncbi:MAG: hemerythrin family protein [Thermodesulfovibrionales bacterium]
MEWTTDLSVGVETIDEQHRELFVKINDLVAAIKGSVCKYKIGDVIGFLEDYVAFHFGQEEAFMESFGYPAYPAHKAQHEEFKRNFSLLKKDLVKLEGGTKPGSYDLSVRTNQVVVDWILEHISKTDKALGAFLKDKV